MTTTTTAHEVAAAVRRGDTVIDVRTIEEYTAGHVPGAVFMPLHVVPLRLSEFSRRSPVYVVCESGARAVPGLPVPRPARLPGGQPARRHVRLALRRPSHRVLPRSSDPRMTTLDVVSLDTPNLGDRSYVVGNGSSAIVIDPQRDIDRVEQILDERGWTASHVLETHFHNDYVSGGLELARQLKAEYVVPSGMDIAFTANQASDKDELSSDVGLIRVLHTPGHTPNHLSFSVNVGGEDLALFTGGSLLFGSVGRPDLLGPDLTEPLARAQWASMRRIAAEVTRSAQVYPTHGFGSFCSATATVGNASTVAEQMTSNPAFTVDEETFVSELIAGLDAFPAYYAHMGPANQAGAGPIDLSLPQVATAQDIARRIAAGEWVVDLRHRRVFAADHVKGSLSFDVHGNAVTYLGWMIDWGTPITLLGADADEVSTMQRELVRIGIDRPVAYAVGAPSAVVHRRRRRCRPTVGRRMSRWPRRSRPTPLSRCSTCDATASSTTATWPAPSTCRCTSSAVASRRSRTGPGRTRPTVRCGSTAAAASAPPSARRCSRRRACPSCTSTTTSRTPRRPDW